MKKLFNLTVFTLFLCACAGMSSFDGNSTKKWINIESSKQDLEGKTIDVCYRLNVFFSPREATKRFDTDKACITKCCWYSDTKQITLHLNTDFANELTKTGKANKYTLDTLVFNIRYSNLLDTIHASVKPGSVLRSDGLITLDYTTVKNDKGLLKIDLGDLKVQDYSNPEDGHKGTYLYKEQEQAMSEHEAAIKELRELSEYQKVDTGLTPGETVVEKTETIQKEAPILQEQTEPPLQVQKTVIGTLQTQPMREEAQKTVIGTLQTQPMREEAQKTLKEKSPKPQEYIQKTEYVFMTTEVYDLNDPEQRQILLEKKLAYERSQAVALLKQFYEKDIDQYIRSIDKEQGSKGYVLLANDRTWKTAKIGYPIYKVSCNVNGKLGKTKNSMKEYLIPCGIYEVNLDEKNVSPKDITAITIVNKDYLF